MDSSRIRCVKNIIHFSPTHVGYVLAIAAAALAGLIHSISKPLLSSTGPFTVEINPVTLAAIIYIINGLFFTPIKKNTNIDSKISRKNFLILAIVGVAEVTALIMYFFGLKDATATHAAILNNGEMIFTVLIAMTIFREKLQKKELAPFSMIIIGIAVLPIAYDFYHNGMVFADLVFGDMLILFAGVFFAIDINLSRYLSNKIDARRIVQLASFAAGGFAFCLILIFQIPFEINLSQIPSIVIIGLFGTGVSTFFFLISLKLLGAIRTILLYSTTIVFGIIFASIFLHEIISLSNILSIILVSIGIYLLRNRLGKIKMIDKPIEK